MKGFVDGIFIDMYPWFYELDGVGLGVWSFVLFMYQALLTSRMGGFSVWCGCYIVSRSSFHIYLHVTGVRMEGSGRIMDVVEE